MPIVEQRIGQPTTMQTLGQWVKTNTIRIAEEVLQEEVSRGFDNQPIVITDNVVRRDYVYVKPFGKIEFQRRSQIADIILWTLDELRKLSPVLTGFYISSHEPLINGKPIEGNVRQALLNSRREDTVTIVNTAVYAGKIEGRDAYTRWETRGGKRSRRGQRRARGWTAAMMRGQSAAAKGGVYRRVLAKIKSRYGNTVAVDYRPQELPGGVRVKVSGRRGGRTRAQVYPTITLRLFDA